MILEDQDDITLAKYRFLYRPAFVAYPSPRLQISWRLHEVLWFDLVMKTYRRRFWMLTPAR